VLLRVTDQFGSGFTVYVRKAIAWNVRADYEFMGYSVETF
jgi:hypothetical protein